MPIPRPLKRFLLPLWNGGHHLARRWCEYAGAVIHGRFETCSVCGRFGPMLYRPRAVAQRLVELWGLSPRLAMALRRKESLDCARCGAKLRARRLAQVVLDLYPVGEPPRPAPSVRAWVAAPETRAFRVAEINGIEGLHAQLRQLPNLAYSEFDPPAGVRGEDLTHLSYPDASFDLVLTSETLEHVPDLSAALREIRRVLRPGGRHVFTMPLLPGVERTFARKVVEDDGSIRDLAPPLAHPGGDVGYPVFTEFGADLPDLLRAAGFQVEVRFGPAREDDIAQVFVARRPADGS